MLGEWGADNVASHLPLRRLGYDEDLKGTALLFASAAGRHIKALAVAVAVSAVSSLGDAHRRVSKSARVEIRRSGDQRRAFGTARHHGPESRLPLRLPIEEAPS